MGLVSSEAGGCVRLPGQVAGEPYRIFQRLAGSLTHEWCRQMRRVPEECNAASTPLVEGGSVLSFIPNQGFLRGRLDESWNGVMPVHKVFR